MKIGDSWHNPDLVICGLEGNYLNPRYILKMFDKLLTEAGLPHMRIHDLRHCVITLLTGEGIEIGLVETSSTEEGRNKRG